MGLNCKKQVGKFKSIMRKIQNELEEQKKLAKEKSNSKRKSDNEIN